MADEGYGRSFPGDPNPPAKASVAPPAEETIPQETGGGGSAESIAGPPQPSLGPKATFRVVNNAQGERDVFMMTDDLETTRLGTVNIPDADVLLNSLSTFDSLTKTWEVPEKIARDLMAGDMPLPEYLPAKYRTGKAQVARGLIGADWLRRKIETDEAVGRGDLELLKMQMREAPLFAWQGNLPSTVAKMWDDLKEAGPLGVGRRAVGEAAQVLPFMTDSPMLVAGGLTIGASLAVTKGAAAPVIALGVAKVLESGAGALVFKRTMDIEGGNIALDMLARGHDEETVRKFAPAAGVLMGALEVVSFRILAAPFKRMALRGIVTSQAVKKVLVPAYVNYLKELGGEITVEEAQEIISIMADNMAAEADKRPDLLTSKEQALNQLVNVGLQAAAGMAVIKAPGGVLEAGVQRADTKAETKAAAEMTAKLAERKKAQEATSVEGVQTPITPTTPAIPVVPESTNTAAALQELVEGFDKGAISAEELVAGTDVALSQVEETQKLTGEPRPKPPTFEEQTRNVETKARLETLRSDLLDNETLINELAQVRERFARNEMSTRKLDAKIQALFDENAGIRGDIEFFDKQGPTALVTEQETLSMKPATLENIVQVGFKEGRKEVIKVRAQAIKDVAARLELTETDVRKLLKDKNIGLMGDVEFRNWLEGKFKPAAKDALRRRIALREVRMLQKEKMIQREKNIQALHKLPAPAKMTTQQLREYAQILADYDVGDEALTPRRIQALETTIFAGAKTMQDVLKTAAQRLNRPLEELLAAKSDEFDLFRYDTLLAAKSPFHHFVVSQVKLSELKAATEFQALKEKIYALGAKAAASRPRGVRGVLAPTMPEVMAHLEAEDGQINLPELTSEEQAFTDFLEAAYADAYGYLLQTGELQSSRFAGGRYFFHAKRPISEMLADVKDWQGVKNVITEMVQRWQLDETKFAVVDSTGKALGLRKFFKQTLFRSGELTPSQNVIKSSTVYFQQFYKKKALDEAIPTIETLVMALRSQDFEAITPEGEARHNALETFVKHYLNAKKGQSALSPIIRQGGKIDAAIRFTSDLVSLLYIAFNIPLEVASRIGETTAEVPVLGLRGIARATTRRLSKEGKAILEKYKAFTGDPVLEQIWQPGRNLEDQLATLAYGLFQANQVHTLQDLILGNMTDAEFKAGALSDARLAEIKLAAGRWLDLPGTKSILGSTSTGAALTKFRGWAIPIFTTTAQDALALIKAVGTLNGKPMTAQQSTELYRIAEVVAIGALVTTWVRGDEDDEDSFTGKARKYAVRELGTLFQALKPTTVLTLGAVVAFLERLAKNLELLVALEQYSAGEKEGQLKGPPALLRQFTPAAVRQFQSKEEE